MKDTDMNLQAIKEKLQHLQAEPVDSEVLSMPWSSSQQMPLPIHHRAPAASGKDSVAAIEKLQRRSAPAPVAPSKPSIDHGSDEIAQQIYRLEILANNINVRSQKQAAELVDLKRSAQQAAVRLRRQGIHTHPQLAVIESFLAQQSETSVPQIARDRNGQFYLSDTVIHLNQAEQEALTTAQKLRNRHAPQRLPFSQPITPTANSYPLEQATESEEMAPSSQLRSRKRRSVGLFQRIARLRRRALRSQDMDEFDVEHTRQASGQFSLADSAIWFCAAAIARIIIEAIVLSVPILRMPMLLVLFSAISFSIYRVVISKSNSFTSAYRLGIVLLGLFIGGSF